MLNGSLFTRDFLTEGICGTADWSAFDDSAIATARARIASQFAAFGQFKNPSEAETEKDLIWPLLEAVGWADMSVQQNLSAKARDDVPDALLFGSAEGRMKAAPLAPWQRFQHGVCVVEAKRWNRVLDREDARRKGEPGVPSTQILRYLRRVDDVTNGTLRWGILTNGRHWRLYFRGALSVAEDFLEIDLGKVLGIPGCEPDLLDKPPAGFKTDDAWCAHLFKLFVLIFGREAFLPTQHGESFHQLALREGKQWEARVARDLSDTVFKSLLPTLAQALVAADGHSGDTLDSAYLDEVRDGALILLYRLLFVLFAEDRDLLPDESGPYAEYSLTRLRQEIAEKRGRGVTVSARMTAYWSRLDGVFTAIGSGDDALGIPPYNGGLFAAAAAPILARIRLPDAAVADLVFGLSHIDLRDGRPPKYINYRDLSVQQLGSVYERILEHRLKRDEGGQIVVDRSDTARRDSASFYTAEELVGLIIERAVGPLVSECRQAFDDRAAALASDSRPKEARLAELFAIDPASRLLDLKICDPAMGSGHFLVSLVDWLADRVLVAMEDAAASVGFADYTSPLSSRIEAIRGRIIGEAKAHGWPLAEGQLNHRQIVRRMVLKRCVYGVDKNPMAVELAKVSLWLHSFTVGAPLSFLDHHLRHGDSVVGAWTRPTVQALKDRGALFSVGSITTVEQVARLMEEIEDRTDSDIAEVHASAAAFGAVEDATMPVAALFSLVTAERMAGLFAAAPKRAPAAAEKMAGQPDAKVQAWRKQARAFENAAAFGLALEGAFGDPVRIATGEVSLKPSSDLLMTSPVDEQGLPMPDEQLTLLGSWADLRRRVLADRLVTEARARAKRHAFFHWEIGFPNVWSRLLSAEPQGGFDAVIGNPPYIRQEALGEEIKRALKGQYEAFDGMADLYVYFYEQGLKLLRPGGRLSYVVTNKWLKAGYAEKLRELFSVKNEVEFVADFGHAKHFFPDADVFPSVLVVRKPLRGTIHNGRHPEEAGSAVSKDARPASVLRDEPSPALPEDDSPQHDALNGMSLSFEEPTVSVCVIPREAVPEKGLSAAVSAATYPLPRAHFTRESWVLEPPDVVALLNKIRRNGVPLATYAGVKPLYGIKTGLNEAFLIDTPTRDRLVRDDPGCAEIIKPYLRGQDIERWWSPDSGLHMIVLKSSGNHPWPWAGAVDDAAAEAIFERTYPTLHRHLRPFETEWRDRKGETKTGLRAREDQGRFWWELRACDYYPALDRPKILYVDITWSASFSLDRSGRFTNNTGYFVPADSEWLTAVLNAPVGWHYAWRRAQHGKDEALRYFTSFVENYSVPRPPDELDDGLIPKIGSLQLALARGADAIHDWLYHEFGLAKPGRALDKPHRLDADRFVTAVRAALPRSRKWSAAEIARLKLEHAATLAPAAAAAVEILTLERKLSDLVNAAYGLTPEEVALMWRTAPPRMPLDPTDELRRLELSPS